MPGAPVERRLILPGSPATRATSSKPSIAGQPPWARPQVVREQDRERHRREHSARPSAARLTNASVVILLGTVITCCRIVGGV